MYVKKRVETVDERTLLEVRRYKVQKEENRFCMSRAHCVAWRGAVRGDVCSYHQPCFILALKQGGRISKQFRFVGPVHARVATLFVGLRVNLMRWSTVTARTQNFMSC